MTRARRRQAEKGALRHDLRATQVPIGQVRPWDRNPRINDAAAKRLARTIEAHGWTTPLLVQRASGRCIAGHTRLKAAALLELDEVPVVYLDVDDRRATEIALADNRLGELAEWQEADLATILRELEADGSDIDEIGWTAEESAALTDDGPLEQPWSGDGTAAKRPPIVLLAVSLEESADIERALERAQEDGAQTRGAALATICAEWLGGAT